MRRTVGMVILISASSLWELSCRHSVTCDARDSITPDAGAADEGARRNSVTIACRAVVA
jgi:hypothetical protein